MMLAYRSSNTTRFAGTHAAEHAREHFGLSLQDYDIEAIRKRIIRRGDGIVFLKQQGRSRFIVAVERRGIWFPVVWDAAWKSVVTVLPKTAIRKTADGMRYVGRKGREI